MSQRLTKTMRETLLEADRTVKPGATVATPWRDAMFWPHSPAQGRTCMALHRRGLLHALPAAGGHAYTITDAGRKMAAQLDPHPHHIKPEM